MANDDKPIVTDREDRRRYEITIDGHRAMLTYTRRPGTIELIHTEVSPDLQGRGLASLLAQTALDAARAAGVRVIATCPYVRAWVERHPEYQPLLVEASAESED